MNHLILLGDSIFDNGRYVSGGSPIIEQLRSWLGRGWRATLLARDGAVTADIPKQLARLPQDASHVVISAGGNDALENSGVINSEGTVEQAFTQLASIQRQFRQDYQEMLQLVLSLEKPTVICTIYDSIPEIPREVLTGLAVFNDVILREGIRFKLPILDLRLICDEPKDYSVVSPIEPSEIGGAKIVRGIRRIVTGHDFHRGESVVYAK